MSLSESQYYEAKVFMKAYLDAHATLKQCAKQEAEVQKLKYYQSVLVPAVKNGQIKITDNNHVAKGVGFQTSTIAGVSSFVKGFFAKHLESVKNAKTTGQLEKQLEKAR